MLQLLRLDHSDHRPLFQRLAGLSLSPSPAQWLAGRKMSAAAEEAREAVTIGVAKAVPDGEAAPMKEGEDAEEEDGKGTMKQIYKHLLPVLAVVIVVAQLRKIALTPAHHVGAVW